jgi:hypothetical protein
LVIAYSTEAIAGTSVQDSGYIGQSMGVDAEPHSYRAELARLVLEILKQGFPVPAREAIQLRNWAAQPDDSILSLEDIATRILDQEEKQNEKRA